VKFETCESAGTIVAETTPVLIYDSTRLFATGNSATVSWQSSSNGTLFSNAGTGDTLNTGKLSATTFYRTIVTGTCANDTSEVFKLQVIDPSCILQGAQPLVANENVNWNYNMGYRFRADINGTVEELGGRWANGVSHTVRLYSYPAGAVLASANVTGADDEWAYTGITPVSLVSGTEYVVAVRLTSNNTGVSGTVPGGLPYSSGDVTIITSMYRANSNLIPNTNSTTTMYGWADMKFVPCVNSGDVYPSDTIVCSSYTFALELKYSVGNIQWQSSLNGTTFSNISGAIDSVLTVNGISSNTYYRAIASSVCGADTSDIQLIVVSGSGQIGLCTGTQDADWFNVCNWADGTVPVNGDSAIFVPGTNVPTNIAQVNLRYLSLNNSNGLNLTNRLRVNDSLDLINGNIVLNNQNLIVGPNANIGNNFAASYIVCNGNGAVRLRYNAVNIGTRRVPIGDPLSYSYAEFNLTTGTLGNGAYISVRTLASDAPNISSPLNKIERHWVVDGVNITSPNYSASFLYDDGDVIGSESDLSLQLYNGSTWIHYATANTSQNTLAGTGITQFGTYTAFDKEAIESAQTGQWNQNSTWVGGVIPSTTDQALIVSPHTVTLTANTKAGGINIATGASLDIQTNDLSMTGSFVNDGSFTGTGIVSFDGTSTQDIGGSSNTQVELLEINNAQGVEISSGEVLINNRIDINTGTLTTNGNLTLLSDSNRTANLGEVTGSLSGTIKAQRHIDGMDNNVGWRHLTSPIQSTTLQDFKYNNSTYPNGIYFYGFTGSNQSWTWANAYRFSEPAAGISGNFDDGWIAASNISNGISHTLPYTIYTGGPNFPEYDLEVEGYTNVGAISISGLSLTGTNRWHLIGNPYPSSIDWSAVTRTGVDAICYLFSETNGGYVASNLLPSPNLIGSFQGLFIRVNNATNSITFNENDKVTSDAPFQKALSDGDLLRMKLSNLNNGRWSPAAIDWVQGASPHFDSEYDAYKLYNGFPFPNLGIFTDQDTTEFQVAADAPGKSVYTYFLRTLTSVSDTMELHFEEFPTQANLCMLLYDRELDSTMLVTENLKYTFYLSDTTDFARFELTTFDVDMGPQVEHISCFGEVDGKIVLELPKWTAFNVTWSDSLGNLLRYNPNVYLSDSIIGLSGGDYNIEFEDTSGTCRTLSKTLSVFEPQEVIADFSLNKDTLEIDEELLITNLSQGASSFYWTLGDGTLDTSFNASHSYSLAGNYTINLLSAEGECTDTSSKDIVVIEKTLPASQSEIFEKAIIALNTNQLKIEGLDLQEQQIELSDVKGQVILSSKTESPTYYKDGLGLSPGVYFLIIDDKRHKISVQ